MNYILVSLFTVITALPQSTTSQNACEGGVEYCCKGKVPSDSNDGPIPFQVNVISQLNYEMGCFAIKQRLPNSMKQVLPSA